MCVIRRKSKGGYEKSIEEALEDTTGIFYMTQNGNNVSTDYSYITL